MSGIENLNFWEPNISYPNIGDHLAVEFVINGNTYHQHGIFLGLEKGVAVFGGTNNEIAAPSMVTFSTFISTGTQCLTRYTYTNCLPPDDSVQNAVFLFHNPQCAVTQNVLKNNCMAIATICKTSVEITSQIKSKIAEYIGNHQLYFMDVIQFVRNGIVR